MIIIGICEILGLNKLRRMLTENYASVNSDVIIANQTH